MGKLKLVNNVVTVGTWNVHTLWATGKLELLRHGMKRFRYDIIGISEVRWTGKGETSNGDIIWSGEDNTRKRGRTVAKYESEKGPHRIQSDKLANYHG